LIFIDILQCGGQWWGIRVMSLVGRLEDLALSDIFQILSVGRKTGILIIKGSRGSAMIVFKNGLIVRAESNAGDKTIADDLLRGGYIKQSTKDMALSLKKKLPDKSVAEILYELGAVKKEVIEKVAKKRMERLIFHLLQWPDGNFQFELDSLDIDGKIDIEDTGWEVSKGVSPEYLLMEGARVYDESAHGLTIEDEEIAQEEEQSGWDTEWATDERKDISSLRSLSQELRFPNSTSEITLLVLRFASEIFQRGVLFKVDGGRLSGLGQFGLEIENADKKIRETIIDLKDSDFLSGIIKESRPYKGVIEKDTGTEFLIKELGGGWPHEVAIFPLIAEARVVALLYADNLPDKSDIGQTEGLEIFISQAGLALEKAILQSKLKEFEKRDLT